MAGDGQGREGHLRNVVPQYSYSKKPLWEPLDRPMHFSNEKLKLTQTWARATKPQKLGGRFREEPSSSTSAEGRVRVDTKIKLL